MARDRRRRGQIADANEPDYVDQLFKLSRQKSIVLITIQEKNI